MRKRQVMKKFFYSLFIAVGTSAICPSTAFAQNNCVCAICHRSCDDIRTMGHVPGYSCCAGSGGAQSNQGSTSGGQSGGGQDIKTQMLETIVGSALQSILASPDNSKQEQLEKEKQLADEQARLKALQEWQRFQYEEGFKKKLAAADRSKQGEAVLSQMQSVGSGGTLKLLSVGNANSGIKAVNPEDDLVRQAREQLLAADQEIIRAQQAGKNGLNKKEQVEKEYNNLSVQMQRKIQTDDK